MTIALIILAYVATVFLNRWLNKIAFKKYGDSLKPEPWMWFASLFFTLTAIIFFFCEWYIKLNWYIKLCNKYKLIDWFTGKHW